MSESFFPNLMHFVIIAMKIIATNLRLDLNYLQFGIFFFIGNLIFFSPLILVPCPFLLDQCASWPGHP